MSKKLTEAQVLKALNIPDFRHITKDKVISFASMLNTMEPEVAKKALDQFPEFARLALSVLQEYKGVIEKAQDSTSASAKQCLELYNEVIQALKACLAKEHIPFEEKKYYIDNMMEIAKMAEAKDSEGKQFNWKILGYGAAAVIFIAGAGAAILGGNIHFPSNKS